LKTTDVAGEVGFLIALGLVFLYSIEIEMSSLLLKCCVYYSVFSFHNLQSYINNIVLKPNTSLYLCVFLTAIRIQNYLVLLLFVCIKRLVFGKKRSGIFLDEKEHQPEVAKNLKTKVLGFAQTAGTNVHVVPFHLIPRPLLNHL